MNSLYEDLRDGTGTVDPWPQRYVDSQHPGRQFAPSMICHAVFTNPVAADTNGISEEHAGPDSATTVNMPLDGDLVSGGVATLPEGRPVLITVTHASAIVAMNGVITGTDAQGRVITENWSVTASGTSKTYQTAKAFKTVTQITETVAADASANDIIAGFSAALVVPFVPAVDGLIKERVNGTVVTNGTLVGSIYTPNSAPNGTNDYDVWYLFEGPINP